MYRTVYLKKQEERRLLAGHLWVYSNEIDTVKSPLSSFTSGEIVRIAQQNGKVLGTGYINPHTLLCFRLLSYDPNIVINQEFFKNRLQKALSLREELFTQPYYRWVYGESDLLPGLVIDRFNDAVAIQITTAGIDQFTQEIISALQELVSLNVIILRNDIEVRKLEQLPLFDSVVVGTPADSFTLQENNLQFQCDSLAGQKTGWFYDHRDNRAKLQRYVKDKDVLDLFSYVGSWGINAANYGAKQVLCVDASKDALEWVKKNSELNNLANKVATQEADVFDFLKDQIKLQKKYDVVIIDPPAFIKKRKDLKNGLLAYQRLNEMSIQILNPDGILVTSSCSMHLETTELNRIVLRACRKLKRNVQILEQGHQGPDHPIHPAIPETSYLKALFYRIG